uniref:Uncharacterized protein n=1 Tax=Panagrolaimus sp. JU765 TaxID=591449 RepID=A0AC34QB14_9BILA
MNIAYFLLFMPLLYQMTSADCGCGIRCVKYTSAKECTRCCTHSVRRSVPVDPFNSRISAPVKIYDVELSNPVDEPAYFVVPRPESHPDSAEIEKNQLSTLISNLYLEELNSKSAKQRRTLKKARSKLQRFYRTKIGAVKERKTDEEMFQMLELLLKEMRLKQTNSTKSRFSR